MSFLPNNSTNTPLLANEEFIGESDIVDREFVSVQCSFDSNVPGIVEFYHSIDGFSFATYGDSYPFSAGSHSRETSTKGRYFKIRFINGNQNQTSFNLFCKLNRVQSEDINVNTNYVYDSMTVYANPGGFNIRELTTDDKVSVPKLEQVLTSDSGVSALNCKITSMPAIVIPPITIGDVNIKDSNGNDILSNSSGYLQTQIMNSSLTVNTISGYATSANQVTAQASLTSLVTGVRIQASNGNLITCDASNNLNTVVKNDVSISGITALATAALQTSGNTLLTDIKNKNLDSNSDSVTVWAGGENGFNIRTLSSTTDSVDVGLGTYTWSNREPPFPASRDVLSTQLCGVSDLAGATLINLVSNSQGALLVDSGLTSLFISNPSLNVNTGLTSLFISNPSLNVDTGLTSLFISNPSLNVDTGLTSIFITNQNIGVTGSLSISNFPAIQNVQGSVKMLAKSGIDTYSDVMMGTFGNIFTTLVTTDGYQFQYVNNDAGLPILQTYISNDIGITGVVNIGSIDSIGSITNGITVNNFPTTIQVSNFPSGITVNNFPITQGITGSVFSKLQDGVGNSITSSTPITGVKSIDTSSILYGKSGASSIAPITTTLTGTRQEVDVNMEKTDVHLYAKKPVAGNAMEILNSDNHNHLAVRLTNDDESKYNTFDSSDSGLNVHITNTSIPITGSIGNTSFGAKLQDGSGTAITSTLVSLKQAIDVNIAGSTSLITNIKDSAGNAITSLLTPSNCIGAVKTALYGTVTNSVIGDTSSSPHGTTKTGLNNFIVNSYSLPVMCGGYDGTNTQGFKTTTLGSQYVALDTNNNTIKIGSTDNTVGLSTTANTIKIASTDNTVGLSTTANTVKLDTSNNSIKITDANGTVSTDFPPNLTVNRALNTISYGMAYDSFLNTYFPLYTNSNENGRGLSTYAVAPKTKSFFLNSYVAGGGANSNTICGFFNTSTTLMNFFTFGAGKSNVRPYYFRASGTAIPGNVEWTAVNSAGTEVTGTTSVPALNTAYQIGGAGAQYVSINSLKVVNNKYPSNGNDQLNVELTNAGLSASTGGVNSAFYATGIYTCPNGCIGYLTSFSGSCSAAETVFLMKSDANGFRSTVFRFDNVTTITGYSGNTDGYVVVFPGESIYFARNGTSGNLFLYGAIKQVYA